MFYDWFRPRILAKRLALGKVSNVEVAYLMLANFLLGSSISYGAFTWSNPPWTALSVFEFGCVVVVTILGFAKVYEAAGGEKNSSFAALFSCLSFGVWFWSTVIVWTIYWGVIWAVEFGVSSAYRFNNIAFANNLAAIGGNYEWFWTFLAALLWQVLYFSWIARVIPRVR